MAMPVRVLLQHSERLHERKKSHSICGRSQAQLNGIWVVKGESTLVTFQRFENIQGTQPLRVTWTWTLPRHLPASTPADGQNTLFPFRRTGSH